MARDVDHAEEEVLAVAEERLDEGLVEGTAGILPAVRRDGSALAWMRIH